QLRIKVVGKRRRQLHAFAVGEVFGFRALVYRRLVFRPRGSSRCQQSRYSYSPKNPHASSPLFAFACSWTVSRLVFSPNRSYELRASKLCPCRRTVIPRRLSAAPSPLLSIASRAGSFASHRAAPPQCSLPHSSVCSSSALRRWRWRFPTLLPLALRPT